MTDEELQQELLRPAAAPMPADAPPAAPDDALAAELLTPASDDAAATAAPTRAANGRVYVLSPSGNLGTVDEAELPTLGEGYQLADEQTVQKQIEAEEYGDVGSQIGAGLEGVAQGASLGGYGALASLASDDYDRERRLREEHNPVTSTVGNVVGAVAPALLSGGAGAAGTVARLAPAALEANLGARLAAHLGTKAAAWTASRAGQVGARAIATGLESAADQAIRTVLDDAANGDVDVTAERMLDSVWKGGGAGAGLELGLGALGAVGRAGARAATAGAKKAAGLAGDLLPSSLSDAAGEAAYKAAVGRTNITSQRLAKQLGGASEVGKTLLDKGLVKAGDTVDAIAERLPVAREALGEEIGAITGEVADAAVRKDVVNSKIGKVLAEYDKPGQRDIAKALRSKLEASGIDEVFAGEGDVALKDLLTLRRAIDQRPDLKFGTAGPNGVDLTTEGMRDIRRVLSDAFIEAGDDVSKARGIPDFAERLRKANREYSHVALAADEAEKGALSRLSNNRMGLNDVLAGVGGAAAMGPVGALGAVASKVARDRFEATSAAGLSWLAKRGAKEVPLSPLGKLTSEAANTQMAIEKTADDTIRSVFQTGPRQAARAATASASAGAIERAMEQAVALQDPESPPAKAFASSIQMLSQDDPALAQAIQQKVQARSDFLASKMPPPVDPGDPLGVRPGRMDSATQKKSQRYVEAAINPQAALQRLSAGVGTREDIETLRALTPRLYDAYVRGVEQRVRQMKRPPSTRERMKLAYATGLPMDRSSTPQTINWYQQRKAPPKPANAESQNPNLAPVQPAQQPSPPPGSSGAGQKYATRADRATGG